MFLKTRSLCAHAQLWLLVRGYCTGLFLWMSIFWVITVWFLRSVPNLTNLRFDLLLLFRTITERWKQLKVNRTLLWITASVLEVLYATQRVGVRLNEKRALCREDVRELDNPNRILKIANCERVPLKPALGARFACPFPLTRFTTDKQSMLCCVFNKG